MSVKGLAAILANEQSGGGGPLSCNARRYPGPSGTPHDAPPAKCMVISQYWGGPLKSCGSKAVCGDSRRCGGTNRALWPWACGPRPGPAWDNEPSICRSRGKIQNCVEQNCVPIFKMRVEPGFTGSPRGIPTKLLTDFRLES